MLTGMPTKQKPYVSQHSGEGRQLLKKVNLISYGVQRCFQVQVFWMRRATQSYAAIYKQV